MEKTVTKSKEREEALQRWTKVRTEYNSMLREYLKDNGKRVTWKSVLYVKNILNETAADWGTIWSRENDAV